MGLIKSSWIWVLALLVVGGVFVAFRLTKKTDPDYFTAKVEKGDIRQVIEATGTINPVTSVQVGSQVSGMISKLYVDFNSKVTKGQVIAEFDPKLFQGAVLQAQADLQNSQALLAAAKANLAKDQATLQQNKLDYNRAVGLQEQKVAQTNLDYTIIRAPINGTVVARNIDIGQTVAASLQAPTLFMIALDLTKMQVYAKTDEGDVGQIRPDQKADFQVDAFPKEMFHGVVFQVRMNATSIQNVVTYDTIVNFDNPELKLFPGMTAYVSIPVASVNDVVKIPNAALRYKPDLPAEKIQELYSKYGVAVTPSTTATPAPSQPGATGREHAVPKPSSTGSSGLAVVWKLLPDKSLRPVQIHIGLTDHTYTALTAGELQPGEELVTGATTVKQESAGPGLSPQRR